MRRRCVLAIVVVAGLLSACGSTDEPGPPPSAAALEDAEAQIVTLLAQSRVDAGLPVLARDSELDAVARAWSNELAASGELEHNPAYTTQIPDGWTESGENVGWIDAADYSLADLPAALHEAWLESPSHRANIDDPSFTTVGVGIAYDETYGYYVTQDFAAYP